MSKIKEKTTISVYRVDAAEWSKFCRAGGIRSPEAFHTLLIKNIATGETVAEIQRKEDPTDE